MLKSVIKSYYSLARSERCSVPAPSILVQAEPPFVTESLGLSYQEVAGPDPVHEIACDTCDMHTAFEPATRNNSEPEVHCPRRTG